VRPYLEKPYQKKKKKRAGGVAQGEGPEFKPQLLTPHPQKKKNWLRKAAIVKLKIRSLASHSACNLSIWKTEGGGSSVKCQPRLYGKTLSPKTKISSRDKSWTTKDRGSRSHVKQ
jgi:hypothetical protein